MPLALLHRFPFAGRSPSHYHGYFPPSGRVTIVTGKEGEQYSSHNPLEEAAQEVAKHVPRTLESNMAGIL